MSGAFRLSQFYILVLLLSLSSNLLSQNKDYFLYLYNDSLIETNILLYKWKFMGIDYFETDSLKVPVGEVMFMKNEDGISANKKHLKLLNTSDFIRCKDYGKLIVFENIDISTTGVGFNSATGGYSSGATTKRVKTYYSKGYSPIRKVKYKYLVEDLVGNNQSMEILNSYKKISIPSNIIRDIGRLAMLGGLVVYNAESIGINNMSDSKYSDMGMNMVLSGIIIYCGGYIIKAFNDKKLIRAIDVYNGKI